MTKLLIRYKEHNTIEGYVENRKAFIKWLKEHNKQRKEEGELKEYEDEFEIKEIQELK